MSARAVQATTEYLSTSPAGRALPRDHAVVLLALADLADDQGVVAFDGTEDELLAEIAGPRNEMGGQDLIRRSDVPLPMALAGLGLRRRPGASALGPPAVLFAATRLGTEIQPARTERPSNATRGPSLPT